MSEDVVACPGDGRADGRVALQRHGEGEERAADVVLLEDAQEAPDAGAAAVLEERLVGEVPSVERDGRGALAGGLALADAVLEQVLRALLVVDHERDRDAGIVGPSHARWDSAVPDQVSFWPFWHG